MRNLARRLRRLMKQNSSDRYLIHEEVLALLDDEPDDGNQSPLFEKLRASANEKLRRAERGGYSAWPKIPGNDDSGIETILAEHEQ